MLRALAVLCVLLLGTAAAFAFGTEPLPHGVGSEHERITRAAVTDLDPQTLDALAGKQSDAGAVGAPDKPGRGLLSNAPSHCDDGDYLAPQLAGAPKYARTQEAAQAALAACRDLIFGEIEKAVARARPLSNPPAHEAALECRFDGHGGSAKCDVLEHLGLAFHAAQDFYARTNWVDRPAEGTVSADNPPGLGQSGRAAWLDPRKKSELFPAGLISGCPGDVTVVGETVGCEYGDWAPFFGQRRIVRSDLSKDFGPIGRGAGGVGDTVRGKINGNFARAVAAAVEDTRDKWAYFKERIVATYGDIVGGNILCTLQNDKVDSAGCANKVAYTTACAARTAQDLDRDDAAVVPTADEFKNAETMYPSLRGYCVLEESDVTRSVVERGGTATKGRDVAKASAIRALALWNACPAELKRRQPASTISFDIDKIFPDKPSKATEVPKVPLERLSVLYAECILDARGKQLNR